MKKKLIMEAVFEALGVTKHKENLGILTNEIEKILDPIPMGQQGYAMPHFVLHIKNCLPERIRKDESGISHYLTYEVNCSDIADFARKAATNMRAEREAIKAMLRKVGIEKDETYWKPLISHITKLLGPMSPENLSNSMQEIEKSVMELEKGELHKMKMSLAIKKWQDMKK